MEFLGASEARFISIAAAVPENIEIAKDGRLREKESRGYGVWSPGSGSAMPPSSVEFRKLSDIEVRV